MDSARLKAVHKMVLVSVTSRLRAKDKENF